MTNSTMTYVSLFLTMIHIIGLILNVLSHKNHQMGAKLASIGIGVGLIISFLLLTYSYADKSVVYLP